MSCGREGQVVVGLTGGIACGKSAAAEFMERSGWEVISTDAMAGRLLAEDEAVKEAIRGEFGAEVFFGEGTIDKPRLGRLVFAAPSKRRWLEELLHPLIRKEWLQATRTARADRVVVEIPLLYEKELESEFDFVVSVFAHQGTQMHRLQERGLSEEESSSRLAAQLPVEVKAGRADFVLLGEGALFWLQRQVARLLPALA